ncbi:hypothetical protein BOTBODRAFT_461924 [Botryobasidium botryosum FD-172 SS1]|uniref:Uncharacterized protein n=1 Tax=Botryobasidium botryosum (strain FD-172 SS1) TaxID=930990 RepID=A0A067M612_BOTB1|nr:hypothetical protein BOTBODRAFT_461924 [Botryobasidium botryosum FD-172 SS1]
MEYFCLDCLVNTPSHGSCRLYGIVSVLAQRAARLPPPLLSFQGAPAYPSPRCADNKPLCDIPLGVLMSVNQSTNRKSELYCSYLEAHRAHPPFAPIRKRQLTAAVLNDDNGRRRGWRDFIIIVSSERHGPPLPHLTPAFGGGEWQLVPSRSYTNRASGSPHTAHAENRWLVLMTLWSAPPE